MRMKTSVVATRVEERFICEECGTGEPIVFVYYLDALGNGVTPSDEWTREHAEKWECQECWAASFPKCPEIERMLRSVDQGLVRWVSGDAEVHIDEHNMVELYAYDWQNKDEKTNVEVRYHLSHVDEYLAYDGSLTLTREASEKLKSDAERLLALDIKELGQ